MSDVEHDVAVPPSLSLRKLEATVRHCLDEMPRSAELAFDRRLQAVTELEADEGAGDECLRLGEEDELAQPVGEQQLAVILGGKYDLAPLRAAVGARTVHELTKGRERFSEELAFARRLKLELELPDMLDVPVRPHARSSRLNRVDHLVDAHLRRIDPEISGFAEQLYVCRVRKPAFVMLRARP